MNHVLDEYIQTGSADAFGRIVEGQIDSVYSQCLRKLHNVALAEDVTQVVFATLAQRRQHCPRMLCWRAGSLPPPDSAVQMHCVRRPGGLPRNKRRRPCEMKR